MSKPVDVSSFSSQVKEIGNWVLFKASITFSVEVSSFFASRLTGISKPVSFLCSSDIFFAFCASSFKLRLTLTVPDSRKSCLISPKITGTA